MSLRSSGLRLRNVTQVTVARTWLRHPARRLPLEQETDMNDDSHERELSMDELDEVNGTGSALPLAPYAERGGHQFAKVRYGIVDDSV